MGYVVAALDAAAIALLGSWMQIEMRHYGVKMLQWLVATASRLMPRAERDRYLPEWLQLIDDMPTPLGKIWHAMSLLWPILLGATWPRRKLKISTVELRFDAGERSQTRVFIVSGTIPAKAADDALIFVRKDHASFVLQQAPEYFAGDELDGWVYIRKDDGPPKPPPFVLRLPST
jgi:hypothetical protein